jgi:hypothetical protein
MVIRDAPSKAIRSLSMLGILICFSPAEPEGPNHGGSGMFLRTSTGDTVAIRSLLKRISAKVTSSPPKLKTQLQVEWKKAR